MISLAKKFGFFNSINGDRKYLASDISQAFDIGITTGLKAEEGNLRVVPYDGMQVQIQPGSAMIFGHYFMNDEAEIITIDTADSELNRIDRIVVRYDAYTREVNTAIIKGSPALSPTPPARLETNEQYDLVLADIYVPAAATVINESNITDMRESELCGYIGVKGAVSQLDFDAHLAENATDNVHGLAHKGALLMISSAQEFAPNQLITVRWDYADYDTDNFYSSSAPTRITVPEGLNFAKFTVNLRLVNDKVDSVLLTITKNDSPFNGRFDVRHNIGDGTRSTIQGSTPFIPVDKGDYFEVNFRHQSSSSVSVDIADNSASWFSIEAKI